MGMSYAVVIGALCACIFLLSSVNALSVCPAFAVVRDSATGATMAEVQNMDVFSKQKLWDGETTLRVPLENFQRTFPSCFASVDPADAYGGVGGASAPMGPMGFQTAPLVAGTTSTSTSTSTTTTSTSSERIVALPFARNPPPGEDYCSSENAMVSVGGKTYCNDYAQFVLAEEGSTITPLDPECTPPNCYPCAADPTGLGVYASRGVENQQTYCDPDFGLCFRLFVCVPNIGCSAHADCSCGETCAANGLRPTAIGARASEGEKQWYYISDDDQPIFNNTLTAGGGVGCCTFEPREPVCRFQSVSCECLAAYTPVNFLDGAQSYEKKNRVSLSRDFRNNAAVYSNVLQCCTGSMAEPVYFFDEMKQNEYVKYTIASRCQSMYDVERYNSGVSAVQYKATSSFGRTDFGDFGVPPDALDTTACVRVWRGKDFTDVSAYLCTGADGRQGRYGKLEWVARANPGDPDTWWRATDNSYQSGKIGQWNADIRSFVVPANAQVTFFQNNWFGGKSKSSSNCQCSDTKSKAPCCNGEDWNISSLTILLR